MPISVQDVISIASGRARLERGLYLIDSASGDLKCLPGRMTAPAARTAFGSLETAAGILKKFPTRFALVTAPLSKEAILRAGIPFSGHTGYLGRAFGVRPMMLLMSDRIAVGLVTEHIPLSKVSRRITRLNVMRAIRSLARGLAEIGLGRRPNISVLGLNPHAGEGGKIGREDLIIASAIRAFNRLNAGRAVGPLPADSAFSHGAERGTSNAAYGRRRTYLAMYHDQGLIPVKMAGIHRTVNITLGLPIRRTSPAHGTAFDIAGRGVADPRSMRSAIQWAIQ